MLILSLVPPSSSACHPLDVNELDRGSREGRATQESADDPREIRYHRCDMICSILTFRLLSVTYGHIFRIRDFSFASVTSIHLVSRRTMARRFTVNVPSMTPSQQIVSNASESKVSGIIDHSWFAATGRSIDPGWWSSGAGPPPRKRSSGA